MTIPVVAFFNNKGGVGKTSLVYHLAWMYSELEIRVLAADLDPQANLTAAFINEERLEGLWRNDGECTTIFRAIEPIIKGIGDVLDPQLQYPALHPAEAYGSQVSLFDVLEYTQPPLAVLPGDLNLSSFEDDLSDQWPKCLDEQERAFRVTSAFWRVLQNAGGKHHAQLIMIDLGPNLGAINRSALIAADYVVIPLVPDLFSLQGLRNLGPTLRRWNEGWRQRLEKNPTGDLPLPPTGLEHIGYVVLQHAVRLDRPARAYEYWASQIPTEYRESVLDEPAALIDRPADDPHCLALLKHYRSLMPLAQEARKPMFRLKPADGAIGAHFDAVGQARMDFRELAHKIAGRIGGLELPSRDGEQVGAPEPAEKE